ncbi:MAG TPA: hypothetical protein VKP30_18745, partial [Polyangiaceae bacterium]|nr:hypothetical protein [Polyangiaceae bacterium]
STRGATSRAELGWLTSNTPPLAPAARSERCDDSNWTNYSELDEVRAVPRPERSWVGAAGGRKHGFEGKSTARDLVSTGG